MISVKAKWDVLLVVLVTVVGAAQIVSTYPLLTQTWDEPIHIAAGMQWLQYHTYTIYRAHTPLARIAAATGPFLAGRRLSKEITLSNVIEEGNSLLYAGGSYFRNLALARVGILPFFFLASGIVWLWSRRLFGNAAAFLATTLFTTLPPILAHAGLATTDMAEAASLAAALFAFTLWLDKPELARTVLFGVAIAVAILSKISNLVFLPACMLGVLVLRFVAASKEKVPVAFNARPWIASACLSGLIAFLVLWSGYRFSTGPLLSVEQRPHKTIDKYVGQEGPLHDVAYAVLEAPVFPLSEITDGLLELINTHTSDRGVWYFFPAVFARKTPIPFMIFAAVGLAILGRKLRFLQDWQALVPAVAAMMILVVCLPSNINNGVRHMLGMYPLLAVVAGLGAAAIWKFRVGAPVVVALLLWQIGLTFYTRPDYLAYFNEFAGNKPGPLVTADSDLDWGQDLERLVNELKVRQIKKVSIAYYGTADLSRHDLPEMQLLHPYEFATGWVAMSRANLIWVKGFQWLEEYEPVATVGKSIRLYYIASNSR